MDFVFSWNEEVKKHIDPALGKIGSGGNFTAFNNNWQQGKAGIDHIAELTCQ
jgi:hypothetical protein